MTVTVVDRVFFGTLFVINLPWYLIRVAKHRYGAKNEQLMGIPQLNSSMLSIKPTFIESIRTENSGLGDVVVEIEVGTSED